MGNTMKGYKYKVSMSPRQLRDAIVLTTFAFFPERRKKTIKAKGGMKKFLKEIFVNDRLQLGEDLLEVKKKIDRCTGLERRAEICRQVANVTEWGDNGDLVIDPDDELSDDERSLQADIQRARKVRASKTKESLERFTKVIDALNNSEDSIDTVVHKFGLSQWEREKLMNLYFYGGKEKRFNPVEGIVTELGEIVTYPRTIAKMVAKHIAKIGEEAMKTGVVKKELHSEPDAVSENLNFVRFIELLMKDDYSGIAVDNLDKNPLLGEPWGISKNVIIGINRSLARLFTKPEYMGPDWRLI